MEASIEIKFTYPEEDCFTGTISEIVAEIHRRSICYGTCGYEIPRKYPLLLEVITEEE